MTRDLLREYRYLMLLSFLLIYTQAGAQTFSLSDSLVKPGDVYTTREFRFMYDKVLLTPQAQGILDSVVTFMEKHPSVVLEIGQHRDERIPSNAGGCSTCSWADALAEYIISKGVSEDRIRTVGYSATKPLIRHAGTEEEHRMNQRTEFKILRL